MFLIDGPYVSNYLKETIVKHNIPVVKTPAAIKYLDGMSPSYIGEQAAILKLRDNPDSRLYTNSENTLEWIYDNLSGSVLSGTILKVKDKIKFREALRKLHPEFYFKGFDYSQLHTIDPQKISFPVILKPSVGFFSLGVNSVENVEQWSSTLSKIDDEIKANEALYPRGVLNNSKFIIEEVILGDEFAIDCYYDAAGSVVILNMMKHLFATQADVNDRVYITSGQLMEQYLDPIQNYLNKLGTLFKFNNFPAHVEIRIDQRGAMNAIEINPLRFGGWCSTPDLAQYAWGMNVYEAFMKQTKPDWKKITQLNPGKVFALIVLNNSTGYKGEGIKSFNYKSLVEKISSPLELRKTNFKEHPLFGFMMCVVPKNDLSELYDMLHSDLKEFITL